MPLSPSKVLARSFAYAWASPTTMLGLLLVGLSLVSRGRVARVAGAIEAHGGWVRHLLERAVPLEGGADALTLGHVILGRNAESLERHREHEHVHVRQCERWGPLFVPAYLSSSLWVWVRGGDPYLDNAFEREASERGATRVDTR